MNTNIDVHAHAFSADYIDLLEKFGAGNEAVFSGRLVLAAASEVGLTKRLSRMDESRVRRQVLSMAAATPYFDDVAPSVEAARFLNDELADLCRRHPSRFSFFATLPMPHVDAALEEIDRSFSSLGACGVTFTTNIRGRSLTEPGFAEIFAELDRRAAVVFLHPPGHACGSTLIRERKLSWALGAPVEDALCALQLIQAGFTNRYPNVKIILPHLAGFLAHLRFRFDRSPELFGPDGEKPSAQMRKFWYDSSNGEPESLKQAVTAFGIGHILLGTDYPYWIGTDYDQSVNYLSFAGLKEDAVSAIRYGNARDLFGDQSF
jgi:predicted TIM-barrel fold metal-dependent hydrolase